MASLELTEDYVQAEFDGRVTCTACDFDTIEEGAFTTNLDAWGPFQLAQEHARVHGKTSQADSFGGGTRFRIIV